MSIFNELGIKGGKDRIKEEILYSIISCHGLIELEMGRVLQPYGLSPVKMNALMMIKHIGGAKGLPQVDVGRRMIVTAGNITRLIDRMEKDGFVERVAQLKDRRVKLIKITKKGSELLDRVWPIYIKKVHDLLAFVSDQDGARVAGTLDRIRKSLIDGKRGNL